MTAATGAVSPVTTVQAGSQAGSIAASDAALFSSMLDARLDQMALSILSENEDDGSDSESSGFGLSGLEMLASYSSVPVAVNSYNAEGNQTVVDTALTRVGDPYSKSKRGSGDYVDCSYLTQWAYKQAGISIPGTAAEQARYCDKNGYTIDKSELQPGDLIFWEKTTCNCGRYKEIHHVGIYLGNGKIVDASSDAGEVVVRDIWGENGSTWKIVMYGRPQ